MLNIQEPPAARSFALWQLGFRPFFLAAAAWALLAVLLWTGSYSFGLALTPANLSPLLWHGHAMVYGYTLAVITGFLLTAVKNWTGVQTARGPALATLLLLWLAARLLPFVPGLPLAVAAVADGLFGLLLLIAVAAPIIRVRQWKQLGILLVLGLLVSGNTVFWCGALGLVDDGMRTGLYAGAYLVTLLITIMGRRVIPFFIEKGVGSGQAPVNYAWVDWLSVPALLLTFLTQSLMPGSLLGAGVAGVTALLMLARLWGWLIPGLWSRPLVWVLWLGYAWLPIGLLLLAAATPLAAIGIAGAGQLALHAWVYGLMGLVTLGMMARVTIGHTGRVVLDPPKGLGIMFALLAVGALARVIAPLLDSGDYRVWIVLSQVLWLTAFGLFLLHFAAMLVQPRVDGRYG